MMKSPLAVPAPPPCGMNNSPERVLPPNTTARVVIPAGGDTVITESGNAVQAERTDSSATVRVGSGDYNFVVSPK